MHKIKKYKREKERVADYCHRDTVLSLFVVLRVLSQHAHEDHVAVDELSTVSVSWLLVC